MSAYWMVRCHVKDTEVYGKYIELAGPAIEKYGGRFLAVSYTHLTLPTSDLV